MEHRGIPQEQADSGDFASLGLSQPILDALTRLNFTHPTPIQAAVIPLALAGRDVIGLAQTGSGKTAAFGLPLAERHQHGEGVRGLILSPTREIAMQTKDFLDLFGRDRHLATVLLIGGVRIGPQFDALKRRPDLVVATPGRLLDHIERRTVRLQGLEDLVLDEADHMLDLGFLPQIRRVLRALPDKRRTMMFSATMPPQVQGLVSQFMTDPVRIDLLPEGRAAEGIDHRLYLVEERDKKACLISLLARDEGSTLVFLRRKIDAEWACRQLQLEGHPVERIHSDRSQSQRTKALAGFRQGEHRVLVATDVAARGIDIPRIEHIINFNPPETVEDYIHRSGRTARGTLEGRVSTIATWRDKAMIKSMESALGKRIERHETEGVEPYREVKTARRARIRRRLL
ncbi:MAG: DEAD/DEAH box helicase [Acidobacteria bacterium]|nr:DEAD/DEAH box helicase [Acidobacteriota bacterium]